ncbi:TP901 family phage tail tape measure protein [Pseudomonas sp. SJZ085]|uniref:phage tail tape measure protein n=1 Tax=unclassified Pseudomonas TaxID=196821 RepID=UPI00119BE33C|nr:MULTISPECIES: phage tail tape measure protein [unclassified Pseudomonas]TWC12021.1 TP901 family phage tail tape measure protein [Pseudomonas sp. SJZ074]TWC30602.1 TP901 family phage tail tape measure protein [Pseudomonas sp. SJZ085]
MSNSMRLNLIMGLVDKITAPIQKVTGETTRMGDKIKATQAELSRLGSTTKDIEHFKALQERGAKTSAALADAQAKARALGQQMGATAEPSRKMTAEFERATAQVKRLQAQQQAERLELQQTGARLKETGVSTGKLTEATRRIEVQTKRYNDQLAKEQKALDAVAEKQKRLGEIKKRNSDMRMSATADAVGVGAAVFSIKQLVDAYGEVASAQGEIASLGIDTKGIDVITAKAKAFSNQWAGTTTPEFIRAAYDIKSAISTISDEAVGEFTRIAALTGQATKSSTAEMTSLMATGYGIYRRQFDQFGAGVVTGWKNLSAEERDIKFGEYFAAGISATANLYKTDGPQMAAAISNLGAAATSANVSFAEQLAIMGQLQTTMTGSEAATKYRAFLTGAAGAGKKLGLSFLDAEDNLKRMPDILATIQKKYGKTLDALESQELKEAFGTDEAISLIKLLYPEVDTLRGNIDTMGKSLKGGLTEVEKMAATMNAGPAEAFKRLSQRSSNASATIGQVFAPSMIFAAGVLGDLALWVAGLAERFPFLTQVLAYAVIGLVSLGAASIAGRFAFSLMSDGVMMAGRALAFFTLTNLRAQAVLLVTRIRAHAAAAGVLLMGVASRTYAIAAAIMTAAQWALNVALSANPIGLIIIGIMALIAVVVLVVRYWEPLSAFFAGLWESIKAAFVAGWDFIKSLLMFSPLELLIQLWGPLSGFFSGLWEGIKSVCAAGWDMVKGMLSFNPLEPVMQAWAPLTEFFSTLWDGIKNACGSAIEWIAGKIMGPIEAVKNFAGGIFGSDSPAAATQPAAAAAAAAAGPDGSPPVPGGSRVAAVGGVASPAGKDAAPQPVNQYGGITVNAAPGMSEEQVAKKVRAELDARDRQAARGQRGRLADNAT